MQQVPTHQKMTGAELAAILDLARGPAETIELFPGYHMPIRGASAAEWVAYVVRPNQTVRATFTMGAQDEIAAAQGIERGDKFDVRAYLESNIDGGPEVKASMGALFLDHPGDAAVMKSFMALPADRQALVLTRGGKKTWGSDPDRFFGDVGREIAGLDAVVADTLQEPPAKPNRATRRKAKASA